MGQILKEEMKNRILEAAKNEFLAMGFKNASMRSIAHNSDMTVGNLYRYFPGKDQLHKQIVSATLGEIDSLVQLLTNQSLSLKQDALQASFSYEQLHQMIMNLSDQLVEIFFRHKIEFKILMMQSSLSDRLAKWFENVIILLIGNSFEVSGYPKEVSLIANMYARSIFQGVKTMFDESDLNKDHLKAILKIYFNGYAVMLKKDLKEILEETL